MKDVLTWPCSNFRKPQPAVVYESWFSTFYMTAWLQSINHRQCIWSTHTLEYNTPASHLGGQQHGCCHFLRPVLIRQIKQFIKCITLFIKRIKLCIECWFHNGLYSPPTTMRLHLLHCLAVWLETTETENGYGNTENLHVSYCAWCILVLCSFLVAIHCYMLGRVETEFLSHTTLD